MPRTGATRKRPLPARPRPRHHPLNLVDLKMVLVIMARISSPVDLVEHALEHVLQASHSLLAGDVERLYGILLEMKSSIGTRDGLAYFINRDKIQ